jgi:septum formation protein
MGRVDERWSEELEQLTVPGCPVRSSMGAMAPNGVGSRPRLVLASASLRRRELLASVGVEAECIAVDLDEQPLAGESPRALVVRLAAAKAMAGLATFGSGAVDPASPGRPGTDVAVIGADTIVAVGEQIFGKPSDDDEARMMLNRLSGRSHCVWTGVAVASWQRCETAVDYTVVEFRRLEPSDIDRYLASGEHRGKAGAYALQGRAGVFVPRIEGSHHSVLGLPLLVLDQLCQTVAGWPLQAWSSGG